MCLTCTYIMRIRWHGYHAFEIRLREKQKGKKEYYTRYTRKENIAESMGGGQCVLL